MKRILVLKKLALVLLLALGSMLGTAGFAAACTDTEWLIRAYNDSLFRPPSLAEINAFIDPNTLLLRYPTTRFEVAFAIATSPEGETNLLGGNPGVVSGYFQRVLGRDPTSDEVTTFINLFPLLQGVPDYGVLAYLMGGTDPYKVEFTNRALALNPGLAACDPNRAIVNQIFLAALSRNATNGELQTFAPALAGGASLQSEALIIISTPDVTIGQNTGEYFNLVVIAAYERFLHRPPSQQELVTVSNALGGFGGLEEELYAVLMSSPEYCTGQVSLVPSVLAPLPPAQTVQTIAASISAPALAPFTPVPLQPNVAEAAADASALGLQGQAIQLQTELTTANSTVSELQVQNRDLQGQLATANTSVSQLQTQVSTVQSQLTAANGTVTQLQTQDDQLQSQVNALQVSLSAANANLAVQAQTIAAQAQTITDLLNTLFGASPTQDVAVAAQSDAQNKISQAIAQVGANGTLVQQAQSNLTLGNTALAAGDYSTAVKRFRLAYLQAGNAMR
jgi:hypothetical protein